MLSLGMYSSPAPSLRIPCERTISSGSPKSWEESLAELSKGLQVICGSPEEASPKGFDKLSPPSPLQTNNHNALPTIHEYKRTCSVLSPTWRNNSGVPWTPNSSPDTNFKPLLVRHEESEVKLMEKLAKICKTKKNDEENEFCSKSNSNAMCALRRESLKTGFRFQQDVSDVDVDKLMVSVQAVQEVDTLNIASVDDSKTSIVDLSLDGVDITKLICTLSVFNVLFMRERTHCMYKIHSKGLAKTFLPIIIEDEENARVKCVLHVDDVFSADDVHVKILDDHLVVSACKSASCAFKIDIQLPDGVETRSISAKLSNRNQLIVSGVLGSSSRRYTF